MNIWDIINTPHVYILLTNQGPEHKYDADDDKRLYGSEAVRPGDVAGDAVKDVDEDKEHCNEDGHPPWHALRGHEEADPGHDDKHAGREVVGDDVVRHLAPQRHLETRHRIVA